MSSDYDLGVPAQNLRTYDRELYAQPGATYYFRPSRDKCRLLFNIVPMDSKFNRTMESTLNFIAWMRGEDHFRAPNPVRSYATLDPEFIGLMTVVPPGPPPERGQPYFRVFLWGKLEHTKGLLKGGTTYDWDYELFRISLKYRRLSPVLLGLSCQEVWQHITYGGFRGPIE